jgi:hypothetical protein
MATGRPFALRCPKCKVGEDYRDSAHRQSDRGLFRTGSITVAKSYGYRHHVVMCEVWHDCCGRAWWTDHSTAKVLPVAPSDARVLLRGKKPKPSPEPQYSAALAESRRRFKLED